MLISLATPARRLEFITHISTVPPCIAETTAVSLPSTPPPKTLTVSLPSLLALTISANLTAASYCALPAEFCIANLMVRALMSAACAASAAHSNDAPSMAWEKVLNEVFMLHVSFVVWFRGGTGKARARRPSVGVDCIEPCQQRPSRRQRAAGPLVGTDGRRQRIVR